jgi:hypothetical protein
MYKLQQFVSIEEINGEQQLISVFEGTPVFADNEADAVNRDDRVYFVEAPIPIPFPTPMGTIVLTVDNMMKLEATTLPGAIQEIKDRSQQAVQNTKQELIKPSNKLVLAQ